MREAFHNVLTYIFLKLCKCFPEPILQEDQRLSVRLPLHRPQQDFGDGRVQQGHTGRPVGIAGGQGGNDRRAVHVDTSVQGRRHEKYSNPNIA